MGETQGPNNQSPPDADLVNDGPKRVEELARATGAHPPSLHRLLRMLAGNGVFAEDSFGRFELTSPAAFLRTGVPGSLRDAVRLLGDVTGEGKWWNLWGDLQRCVMTGDPEFDRVYKTDFYTHLSSTPGYRPRRVSGLVARVQRSGADAVGRSRVRAEPDPVDGRGMSAGGVSATGDRDRRVLSPATGSDGGGHVQPAPVFESVQSHHE
jgi:multifunctional cyclase/dehydratase/O-methyltransferase